MGKKAKIICKTVAFSLIPAMCAFLSKSDNALDYLKNSNYIGSNVNIEVFKDVLLICSIILTFILLTLNLILSEIKRETYREQNSEFLKYSKQAFIETLANHIGKEYLNINIRIFVPHKTLVWRILNKYNKNAKLDFIIKNIDGLAEEGLTKDLVFEVYPNPQGLVGQCFERHSMIYDTELDKTNKSDYNLSEFQICKTNNLKFGLVCPIYNDKVKIVSILALDSTIHIDIPHGMEDVLRQSVLNFSQQIYKLVPEHFKTKGGI